MDMSEEIPDVSPCFIVPNSQASEIEDEGSAETVLKGLTTLQPPSNTSSKYLIDQKVASQSSESAMPSSSSSDAHSHETSSLTSSKEDSSGEKHATKEHALCITRFERETSITHENIFCTSTPNMVSSVLSLCKTVEQLTPVEHNSTDPMPQQEESKEKETSSSGDFASPSMESQMKEESSMEEPKKGADKQKDEGTDLCKDKSSTEDLNKVGVIGLAKDDMSAEERKRGGVTDLAKDKGSVEEQNRGGVMDLAEDKGSAEELNRGCVRDMAKVKSSLEEQDRDVVIDLTNESSAEEQNKDDMLDVAKDVSSTEKQKKDELIQEEDGSKEHKSCIDLLPKSNTDINKDLSWNSLPRWVQNITGQGRTSPSIATLTRTSSEVSTTSSREVSSRESSVHQWQSENDDVDCGMIETNHDCPSRASNRQEPSVFQQINMRSLSPPVLSQDIFHPQPKGVAVERETTEQQSRHSDYRLTLEKPYESSQERRDPSPTDEVISPSQEDLLCLHLTQSQVSSSPSQRRSQQEKQTSPLIMDRLRQREKERITVCDVTPPLVKLSDTVLVPTPLGHPSTTGHHQDITERQTVAGQATRVSSDSSDLTREDLCDLNFATSRPDSKMNQSTESIESGVVAFHFTPPSMLLKPVTRSSPPCLATDSETSQEKIASTAEFRPVSPELITTSPDRFTTVHEKAVPVPTLSLSAPVPYEENTDEQAFHLQKDVLHNIPTQPTPFARSVFTNVRERFQPAMASSPDDGTDPFEFTDETHTPPLRKRKRKSRREKSNKKRKSHDDDRIKRGTSFLDSNIYKTSEQSKKECFWKIVQTKVITKITTLIETETTVLYTAQDGTVIKKASLHEFSKPAIKTTTEEDETKEEVGTVPANITFGNVKGNLEDSHVEIHKPSSATRAVSDQMETATSRNDITASVKQSVRGNAASLNKNCEERSNTSQTTRNVPDIGENSSSKHSRPVAEESKDIRNIDVAQLTKDCSDISKSCRLSNKTSNNTSPPLFPTSSNSSSTSTSDFMTGNISNSDDMISSSKKKYKRSMAIDNQRTSRRSSNSPRVLHESPRMLHKGTRVLALWYDKHYYPGHVISKCNDDAKYRIEFDDGDRTDIMEQCIIVVDYLPCNQPVMFCEKARGEYVDGVIKGFYNSADERGYKVLREDKRVVSCPRKNVMLNTEQAAIFLSLRDSAVIKDDDESRESFDNSPKLDRQNIVTKVARKCQEKSTRKTRSCEKDPLRKPFTDKNGKRKVQKKKPEKRKVGKVLPEKRRPEEKHRKENIVKLVTEKPSTSETPKSSRKSSREAAKSNDNIGTQDKELRASCVRRRLSTVMNSSPDKTHPIPLRSSPRKLNPKVVKNENLILPTNKDLFRGYGFILTGSDVMNVSNENSSQEEDQSFVREHVRRQIRTGGGEVLEQFLEGTRVAGIIPSNSCFLLSNASQTTAKYFNALVLGVPCLSHAWVRDCCLENRVISYKSYLLPAGKDLITQCLVEEQDYRDALRGIKVHLVGGEEFRQHWTEVLKDAGCKIIKKLPANVLQTLQRGENESVCDVMVVGDGHVVHSTIQKGQLLGIPTVTIHWVKQCILTGERVDFYAHESFIYRVQDK